MRNPLLAKASIPGQYFASSFKVLKREISALMTSRKRTVRRQRPRQEYVYGTTRGEVSEIAISFDPATGSLQFLQEMVDTYTELSYSRQKGPKILARVPSRSDSHVFEIDKVVSRNYTEIFAVDTATSFVDSRQFSVTAVVNVKSFFTVDPGGIAVRDRKAIYYGVPFCFVYQCPEGNPETLGWCLLIDELLRATAYRKCRSIAIVVDSELGRIGEMNARRVPIRDGVMLPENMTLVYATDAAAQTMPNHLIRVADAAATQARDAVLGGRIPVPACSVVGPIASRERGIASWANAWKGHLKLIDRNPTVL